MKPGDKAKRLRFYISSTDKYGHTPLYKHIVFAAKEKKLAGATVLRGVMGFGSSSEVYSDRLWELSDKVPLVVEIIDVAEKIDLFLKEISHCCEDSHKGHLVTVDETTVLLHKAGQ